MALGSLTRVVVIDLSRAGARGLGALRRELPSRLELTSAPPDQRPEELAPGAAEVALLWVGEAKSRAALDAVTRVRRARNEVALVVVARAALPEALVDILRAGADECLLESEAGPASLHRAIVCALERRRAEGRGPGSETLLRFGDFEFDASRLELREHGRPVELQLTPLRLLACLLARTGRTVTREELLREVWQGLKVSDTAISSALKELRHVLHDDGSHQRCIRTLRGRGYRLIVPITRRPPPAPKPGAPAGPRGAAEPRDPEPEFMGE